MLRKTPLRKGPWNRKPRADRITRAIQILEAAKETGAIGTNSPAYDRAIENLKRQQDSASKRSDNAGNSEN